jgi:hypothetical protein
MKMYGVDVAEGTHITNASIAVGGDLPSAANIGELFYYSTGNPAVDGLYVYGPTAWVAVAAPAFNNTTTYRYSQVVAASTWTIVHNLGTKYLHISTFVDNVNNSYEKIIPLSEQIIDENTVVVTFTTAYSGQVILTGLV